jgi:hypothetical protein
MRSRIEIACIRVRFYRLVPDVTARLSLTESQIAVGGATVRFVSACAERDHHADRAIHSKGRRLIRAVLQRELYC